MSPSDGSQARKRMRRTDSTMKDYWATFTIGTAEFNRGVRTEERKTRIDDEQWRDIVEAFPETIKVRANNNAEVYRRFVDAVLWAVDNDVVWASMPDEYGPWRAIYVRFGRWCDKEIWNSVEVALGPETELARALSSRVKQHVATSRRRRARKESG